MNDTTGRKILVGDKIAYAGNKGLAINIGIVTKTDKHAHVTVVSKTTYGTKTGAKVKLGGGVVRNLNQAIVIESGGVPVVFADGAATGI